MTRRAKRIAVVRLDEFNDITAGWQTIKGIAPRQIGLCRRDQRSSGGVVQIDHDAGYAGFEYAAILYTVAVLVVPDEIANAGRIDADDDHAAIHCGRSGTGNHAEGIGVANAASCIDIAVVTLARRCRGTRGILRTERVTRWRNELNLIIA